MSQELLTAQSNAIRGSIARDRTHIEQRVSVPQSAGNGIGGPAESIEGTN